MQVIDYFDRGHDLNPQAICFVQDDTGLEYTYAQIRELTLKIGNGLVQEGFKKEARGAVLSINHPVSFTCALSLMRAGLAWVPIHPGNAIEDNIYAMKLFETEVLFYHSIFEKAVPAICKNVPSIKKVICVDKEGADAQSLDEWIKQYPADEIDNPFEPNALVAIQPTGGTTGVPKGARHTNQSLGGLIMTHMTVTFYDDQPPVYLAAAPMTHAGGYICLSILARGGKVIVQPKVDLIPFLDAIPKYKVTTLFLPPTVIYAMVGLPTIQDYDFSSLKYFIYGASPMAPAKLKEAYKVFGGNMIQMFGQTECLFPITYLSPQDHKKAIETGNDKILSSCGKQAPMAKLAIMDVTGNILPDGETGEIVVRTPMIMQGYHKNPELTKDTFAYGWHHTGDIGYRDAEGYFYIVDRSKDMIISGGFNVFSAEVEKAVLAHPDVNECAVIGIPDEKWGEAVKAVVEVRPGSSVTEEEIIAKCKELVGSVKAPKSVDFIDTIPRSSVGKVLKRVLRKPYWEDKNRNIG
jgi:acyl-CoA synthetase (AMP-forming)/AMP-acid ligase II